jgi:hypothetical protein
MPTVQAEQDNINFLGDMAKDDRLKPDDEFGIGHGGMPSNSFTGKFKKHYRFDRYDEVWAETYENGVLIYKGTTGVYQWFNKNRGHIAFDKVRLWGQRSSALNRMMG